MAEQKPNSKKQKRFKDTLFKKTIKSLNQSIGNQSQVNETKTPGEISENNPFLNQISTISSTKKNNHNEGSLATPDSNTLNNSISTIQFSQINPSDSATNVIPIDKSRKFSGLIKKKSKILRNIARLTPITKSLNENRINSPSNNQFTKRQITNTNEIELEIDNLLKY